MTKKEEILAYCIKENRKLTAKDILSALYPGKPQPYINTQINELIAERKLIREETRPYTVHVPAPGEEIWEIVDHSRRGRSEISTSGEHKAREAKRADVPSPCTKEVEKYLSGWNGLENYTLQERALNKLFFQTYPHNTEIEDVLVKAAALDDFREFYDLKQYDLKHLDRYLWQLGKDKFPKKYYK